MGKASRKAKRKLKANSDSVAPYRVQKMDLEVEDEIITNLSSELPIDGVDEKEREGEEEEEGAPKVITRGSILQRHKLEYKKQREEVRELKDRRQKTKKKQEKKELTREIKAKQEQLHKRHQEELRLFDASVSSPSSITTPSSSLFPLPEKSIES